MREEWSRVAGGQGRLKADVFSSSDRLHEHRQRERRRRRIMKERATSEGQLQQAAENTKKE